MNNIDPMLNLFFLEFVFLIHVPFQVTSPILLWEIKEDKPLDLLNGSKS
jgi:hypothetical protein